MKINSSMRQFMIDRAQTLQYEARQFPQTRRVAANWICQALHIARQTQDGDLYRQISRVDATELLKSQKMALNSQEKKSEA